MHRDAERLNWQADRVRETTAARLQAVATAAAGRSAGLSASDVAATLDVAPRTLRHWRQDAKHRAAKRLGRRPKRSSLHDRQSLIAKFKLLGPEAGVAVYQGLCPGMPRGEVESMLSRFRRVCRKRYPTVQHRLHWLRPHTVWAMDHTHVPTPDDTRIVLSCRDLASHHQPVWAECAETAQETIACLRAGLERAAPLVVKADGGPAFRSKAFLELLDEYDVELLPSPACLPSFNGSCEAAHTHMKNRTERWLATGASFPDACELTRQQANHTQRPWGPTGPTPHEAAVRSSPCTAAERAAFRAAVHHHKQHFLASLDLDPKELTPGRARWIQRAAVTRALEDQGLLNVQRRVVRPPIKTRRTA